jgi:hypothetical protein
VHAFFISFNGECLFHFIHSAFFVHFHLHPYLMQPLKIAVAQFCGSQSVAINLAKCVGLIAKASQQAAKVIFAFHPAASRVANFKTAPLFISIPPSSLLLY